MTLTEFLLSRIAEDEAVARRAGFLPGVMWGYEPDPTPAPLLLVAPARVVAECEAKRQIVAEHARAFYPLAPDHAECEVCAPFDGDQAEKVSAPWPCPTVRAVAAVYADHPDFREEWKP